MFPNPATNSPWGPNPPWAPGGPDWLWLATAGLLALVVLLLLYLAVWHGRSRGRPRCPRCWYDMADAAEATGAAFPVTCPECGKRITKARRLRKTRVRWRLVGVCAALALVATASGLLPRARAHGPLSVAPNWVLLQLIRYEMQLDRFVRYEDAPLNQPQKIRSISTSLGYKAAGQVTRRAQRELNRRNATYTFSRQEWHVYIRRLHELTPSTRLIEGETFPAYAEIGQLNFSRIWHHALYAEVVKLHWRADSNRLYPTLPEPKPPLTNDWLGEGVVIEFQPFYGPPVPTRWIDHDYLIHPDVHAVTYRLVVRRDRRAIGPEDELGPPIELGEMTVEIPIEFRDPTMLRERFPEAYADE